MQKSIRSKMLHLCTMVIFLLFFCSPTIAQASGALSVEESIRNALLNKTSYLFQISDDHIFDQGAFGNVSVKTESGTSNAAKDTEWAENSLKNWSAGLVIRIDHGVVSMEKSNYYNCLLQPLKNNGGVSLSITSTEESTASYMEITGIITGNTLAASQSVATATYSSSADLGIGNSFSGTYTVSVEGIKESQWPPKPVKLNYSMETGGDWGDKILSVTLTWEDDNTSGITQYYEIYREKNMSGSDELMATIPSGTSLWIDDSPGTLWDMFTYYIIVYNAAGTPSVKSNLCIF